jgi:serine/threonine protein kinase
MSIENIDTLLAVLCRLQILATEQVEEVVRELVPLYIEPEPLADYLVEIEWLTRYQVELLFADRWDELILGPYQILDRLGEGGISEVFKAWDTENGRIVALKVLRQHLAVQTDAVHQFQRELQAVTRLSHPNIIKTFDANQVGATHYFAMEWVEGIDLDRFVQEVGPLGVEEACDYIRQVAQGLQHAHQLGLVHRDVKPANLFLINPPWPEGHANATPRRGDPQIKILDWGLARVRPEAQESTEVSEANGAAEKGMLIGTGTSLMQKILQHQEAEPPSVQALRPDVPEELETVVKKMLAKQPEDRFQIPLLVVAALRKFCPGASTALRASVGTIGRPGSSFQLSRPASSPTLNRPSSSPGLNRPSSAAALPPHRPGSNGR